MEFKNTIGLDFIETGCILLTKQTSITRFKTCEAIYLANDIMLSINYCDKIISDIHTLYSIPGSKNSIPPDLF